MIDNFRRAVADMVAVAEKRPRDVLPLAGSLFQMAGHVPAGARAEALAVLAGLLRPPGRVAVGAAADIAVLCGALVEIGTPAGSAGVEVLYRLRHHGGHAAAFLTAWERTGGGPPPDPAQPEALDAAAARVGPELGEATASAVEGWEVLHRYALAAKAVLGDADVRAAVRSDRSLLFALFSLARQEGHRIRELGEVFELLLMAEADRILVLDRASGRAFRVWFDGVGDNFQLHVLLADALVGPEGRGVPGHRPQPEWVASATDLRDDPREAIAEAVWDLVGGDGNWVGNEATPGAVPVIDGERVLVLEPLSLRHTWRTGRRHPHIEGRLMVEEELGPREAAVWWHRVHPPGSVLHPLIEGQEDTFAVVDVTEDQATLSPVESWVEGVPVPTEGSAAQPALPAESAALLSGAAMLPPLERPPEPASVPPPEPAPEPVATPEPTPEPVSAPEPVPGEAPAPPTGPAVAADPPPVPRPEVPPALAGAWERPAPPPPYRGRRGGGSEDSAPGAGLLDPLPPGVSDSSGWGPSWKTPGR
ncbi:hypothetical protein [Nocardiopsis algeriensis]|uniref:Uncharacterized protein n=1 Tax=Nocardiopsis algeriensis TaxID=1478215 RepID=A0A841IQI2_9ACTN|nr:hypothetical protein [Nocardiopsis algeriensis]